MNQFQYDNRDKIDMERAKFLIKSIGFSIKTLLGGC